MQTGNTRLETVEQRIARLDAELKAAPPERQAAILRQLRQARRDLSWLRGLHMSHLARDLQYVSYWRK